VISLGRVDGLGGRGPAGLSARLSIPRWLLRSCPAP